MFRSRLEAKWAAFFDLMGWPWDYEPIDLNGWSPDFQLNHGMGCFVEVKPIQSISQLKEAEKYIRLSEDFHDMGVSNCLVLGNLGPKLMPPSKEYHYSNEKIIRIGWVYNQGKWEDAAMTMHSIATTSHTVLNLFDKDYDLCYKRLLVEPDGETTKTIENFWKEAINITQFQKKNKR